MSEGMRCPYVKKCGGCEMDGRSYETYLQEKEAELNRILSRETVHLYDHRLHLTGMKNPLHYRMKCNAALGQRRDGTILCGSYQAGTHRICSRDECRIEDETADQIIGDIRKLIPSFRIRIYQEDSGRGWLRHIMVRVSHATGEVIVILVAVDAVFPSGKNFVRELCRRHPEISTVILNLNDRDTSMVLGDQNRVLYGKGYITDTLCGVRFRISPGDFFQVNPVMTERIYQTAIAFGKLKKTDTLLDAYCGTGTIGLSAAGRVRQVIGVELNQTAVQDARVNARMNGIRNAAFYAGDAGEFLSGLTEQNSPDVVILDPPRSGTTDAFIHALGQGKPDRIVYVSCNPLTLAEDLQKIERTGYEVREMRAFDQFPFTRGHAETVTGLKRCAG